MAYQSSFTGQQIDNAVSTVINKQIQWDDASQNATQAIDSAANAGALAQAAQQTATSAYNRTVNLQKQVEKKAQLDEFGGSWRLRLSQFPMSALYNVTALTNEQVEEITAYKMWYNANDHRLYYRCYVNSELTDVEIGSPAYILYYCDNIIYRWSGSTWGFVRLSSGPQSANESGNMAEVVQQLVNRVEELELYTRIHTRFNFSELSYVGYVADGGTIVISIHVPSSPQFTLFTKEQWLKDTLKIERQGVDVTSNLVDNGEVEFTVEAQSAVRSGTIEVTIDDGVHYEITEIEQ